MTPLDRSSSAASSPLASRDVNTSAPSPSKPTATDKELVKPKTMEYHRQVLQSRLEDDKGKQVYISPSDMILSPATQKLSALKGRRFAKAKPQSLFARTTGKNLPGGADGSSGLGEEVGKAKEDKES